MKKKLLYILPLFIMSTAVAQNDDPLGYGITPKKTPVLSDSKYVVHDGNRPVPEKVTAGDAGKKIYSMPAPSDAVVLFNGKDLSKWQDTDHEKRRSLDWPVKNGIFTVNPQSKIRMIETVEEFGPVQLHVEWRVPADRRVDSQGGSNSGVFFIGGKYEIQILSSFSNKSYADGTCASIYGQYPPLVNACKPQGEWEVYDIMFMPPTFAEDGALKSPAYVTVIQNGVVVHNHKTLLGPTNWRSAEEYRPHGPTGRIQIQNHDDPIEFRNIWARNIGDYDTGKTPSELQKNKD